MFIYFDEKAAVFARKVEREGGFLAERLAEKQSRNSGIDITFEIEIGRSFVFHAPCPAVNVGVVGE